MTSASAIERFPSLEKKAEPTNKGEAERHEASA